uniref:Replication factor A protein 3 n=1 Tax=Mycena chlorophos TaxID=658473 RepID=A0ABQ0LHC3_MYCCL|nr:predicted protein [Mycena chlorophos]
MSSDSSRPSLRVNSFFLPRYASQTVRLPCKPAKFNGSTAAVTTADGGQVTISLLPNTHMAPNSYYEVLGQVVNATTLKTLQVTELGTNIDMTLVNSTIQLMHDERFYGALFTEQG